MIHVASLVHHQHLCTKSSSKGPYTISNKVQTYCPCYNSQLLFLETENTLSQVVVMALATQFYCCISPVILILDAESGF